MRALAPDVDVEELMRHIRVMASDEFEGRAPATRGEELTVAYLTEQFKALGAAPGNPDGTYVQEVPLMGLTTSASAEFRGNGAFKPGVPDELTAMTLRARETVSIQGSPVVFAGHGACAPEFNWDDFKGQDVSGKTLLVLVNDPGFKGEDMTYYGRWTYKYEEAARRKAAACVIVHETDRAGYPWSVVRNSAYGHENMDLRRADGNSESVAVGAWIGLETARRLAALGGRDFEALKKAAMSREFRPVALGVQANFDLRSRLRPTRSANVAALLEGSDPDLKGDVVVFSAHWDHLGRDPKRAPGDQIYHGAADDASGVAGLLALAKAFAALRPRPKRSILFLATTGEEKGLLGAKHYAENPLYPLSRTVADFNMDIMNVWGRTRDFRVTGRGFSTLDEDVDAVARGLGRTVTANSNKKGGFFRADHFEFAKHGVPALDCGVGIESLGADPGYVARKREEYTSRDYHEPSDVIKPDWDLSGMAEDLRFLYELGLRLADDGRWPRWKPGAEFKDARP